MACSISASIFERVCDLVTAARASASLEGNRDSFNCAPAASPAI